MICLWQKVLWKIQSSVVKSVQNSFYSLASTLRCLHRNIYWFYVATNTYNKTHKEPQVIEIGICTCVTVLLLLHYCISSDLLHDHLMLIIITGNSRDDDYYNADDYKFKVTLEKEWISSTYWRCVYLCYS